MRKIVMMLSCLMQATAFSSVAQSSEYKIINTFPLVGDGGWDYLSVDESSNRLFVSHGTQVQVVDLSSGKLIGSVPGLSGVHGIAIAAEINSGESSFAAYRKARNVYHS